MRPRVVLLSAFLTPYRSGAEACAEEIAVRLNQEFEVIVVTCRLSKELKNSDMLMGVPVIRVGMGSKLDPWLFPFLAPFVAKRLKPKIIHGVLETFAGLALMFCKWIVRDAKRVLTLQTTNRSFLKGLIVQFPHKLTAISSVLVRKATRFGRSDVLRIPNGINLQEIQYSLQDHAKISGRVLFVGRMERMKGVDTLLKAFAQLIKHHDAPSNAHMHLVGDGSERSRLQRMAKELGINERVEFLGKLTDARLHREFAEAEVFAGLSRSEALGNVFLEAQASHCAVLATNTGGIPDVVHDGKTGMLVPVNDAALASDQLLLLLRNQELRERLAKAGAESAARFDWDIIAPRYAQVYRELI